MIIIISAILAIIAYQIYQYIFPGPQIPAQRRAVLISGCDTGFGYNLAVSLYTRNYTVYAGCLTETGINNLKAKIPNANVFKLDITQQKDIDSAVQLIQHKSNGTLYALVNNAGIGQNGHIDWIDLQQYRDVMEVNFFGQVSMTKAFIPLLIKQAHSRVINICSVAGFVGAPGLSSYCCSKFALEAFSDSLRREMHPFNLHVSIIEPGYLKTPILDGVNPANSQNQKLWATMPADKKAIWGESFRNALLKKGAGLAKFAEDATLANTALLHAISAKYPKHRYRVGLQCNFLLFPGSLLPTFIGDALIRLIDGNPVPAFITENKQKQPD